MLAILVKYYNAIHTAPKYLMLGYSHQVFLPTIDIQLKLGVVIKTRFCFDYKIDILIDSNLVV